MSTVELLGWFALALAIVLLVTGYPIPGIVVAILGGALVYNRRSRRAT